MDKRITINDVAAAAQVSNGTVHRALNGKPGVSDAVRERIITIAREIGYEPNMVASALKKKPLRIVVAFPGPTQANRFFYGELWNGYREYRKELITYNLDILETPCYVDEMNSFAANLKRILGQYHGKIDGVIGGGKLLEQDIRVAEKLIQNGIPLVMVSEEVENLNCLCSVQSEHTLDGKMAAELLTAQIPEGSSILMCAGDVLLPSNCANTVGFETFIAENHLDYKIIKLYGCDDFENMHQMAVNLLKQDSNMRGLYSVNARCSLVLAQAVEECGLQSKVRLVGSDLYAESIEYMKKGIIRFIIDKNPRLQAKVGFRRLLNYLVRKEVPADREEYVTSAIICRSNLDKYIRSGQ